LLFSDHKRGVVNKFSTAGVSGAGLPFFSKRINTPPCMLRLVKNSPLDRHQKLERDGEQLIKNAVRLAQIVGTRVTHNYHSRDRSLYIEEVATRVRVGKIHEAAEPCPVIPADRALSRLAGDV